MGFYLDLNPKTSEGTLFIENGPPAVYWTLYAIGIFALFCMGLAAHQVVGGLFQEPSWFDWGLLFGVASVVLLFFLVGFKMAALRKFVSLEGPKLQVGYYVVGRSVVLRSISKDLVSDLVLVNQKPAPNLAPQFHDNPQYFVRGHWRLILITKLGKKHVLDKHVEKEALLPLYSSIKNWQTKVN